MLSIGVQVALATLFIALGVVIFAANRDIFSPEKYLYLNTGVFFGSVFFEPKSALSYTIFLLVCCTIFVGGVLQWGGRRYVRGAPVQTEGRVDLPQRVPLLLLLVGLSMLLAHAYVVYSLGGLRGYAAWLPMRVANQGRFMILRIYSRQILVVYLLFFCILITARTAAWVRYVVAPLLFFATAIVLVMQGSRSTVLLPFLFSIMCWHYLKRRVRTVFVLLAGSGLLVAASFLEVYRRTLHMALHGSSFSYKFLDYGFLPVEIWEKSRVHFLAAGSTLLAGVTNLVPRAIWAGKPDSGGTVLNSVFAHGAWTSSSVTTGIFVEGLINFGLVVGLVFGTLALGGALIALMMWYRRRPWSGADGRGPLSRSYGMVAYLLVMHYVCNLHVEEFAYSTSMMLLSLVVLSGLVLAFRATPFLGARRVRLRQRRFRLADRERYPVRG